MFPETPKLRAPVGLNQAIKAAAKRRHCTAGEFVRQSLLRTLQAEGVFLRSDGKVVQELERDKA